MNPDNPYAAPQTLGQPPLAVAMSADSPRLRFVECSTERLRQLLDYAYAIQQMHVMWILLWVHSVVWSAAAVVITIGYSSDYSLAGYSIGVSVLFSLRVTAGYARGKRSRAFSMGCDGLLVVVSVWLTVLMWHYVMPIIALLCVFVGFHAASSFLAHHHARELFDPRPMPQEELAGEVAYRQLNGIV